MGQTNPDTGSHIDTEDNGDYTITFSMTLPQQPTDDTPTSIPLDEV